MLRLSQDMDMVAMEDMVKEDPMEVMAVTEAMVVMVMERERLKLMLSQVMVTEVMVVMVMEDLMEVMEDTEAMVDMERERLKLSQDMVMEVMDMEDHMEVMVDTEAMGMVVMDMESKYLRTDTTYNAQ